MNKKNRAYLELHFAVLLFGFTAILGDLIALSALVMVWWRVGLASLSLFFLIRFGQPLLSLSRKRILQYMGIGIIVGLHWICFFGSVKYANASVCLVCSATMAFFTALLEPFLLNQKVKWYELLLAVTIIPGMILIVNNLDWSMTTGVWLGLLSAFLAALFSTLNKKLVSGADPLSITFLEMLSAFIFIGCVLPFYFRQMPDAAFWPVGYDWLYLGVLAFLCTTVAYVIALKALNHISAFASSLTYNLEPVYGILLAIVILQENKELTTGFYWGAFIIIASVLGYPMIGSKYRISGTRSE